MDAADLTFVIHGLPPDDWELNDARGLLGWGMGSRVVYENEYGRGSGIAVGAYTWPNDPPWEWTISIRRGDGGLDQAHIGNVRAAE